jgi:putative tryptophan/tyrosine transport system substrate-binding protein
MLGMAWPLVAAAQRARLPRIGILVLGNPDPVPMLRELREGLRVLGYVEGQTIVFDLRIAHGDHALMQRYAYDLAAHKVDLIVAFQTPAVAAAKQATTEIPIVMAPSGDPVGTGLIASLARPGGNITGMASATAELGGKNLELLRDVLPSIRSVGVLANAPDPFHKPFLSHILASAKSLGIEIKPVEVHQTNALAEAFDELTKAKVEAVIAQPSLPQKQVADLALRNRLPCLAPTSNFPSEGGLMSYSADFNTLYREAASFVDKVLKGRKPADLPAQLPTKFQLIVNLKTAKALGLTLPPAFLTRADAVIE